MFKCKPLIYICIVMTLISLGGFGISNAALNEELIFQGKLQNSDGTNVSDGSYNMVFKIYTVAEGGTEVYTETWSDSTTFASTINDGTPPLTTDTYPEPFTYTDDASESTLQEGQTLYNLTKKDRVEITTGGSCSQAVDTVNNTICISKVGLNWANSDSITTKPMVKDGVFSVRIGSLDPTGNNLLTAIDSYLNQDLWLGVQVGANSEMRPRKKLGSVPFALNSARLDGLEAKTSGADAHITRTDSSGNLTISGNITASGNIVFDLTNNVTIQATDPTAARIYTIPDFGADDSFVGLAASQSLTNKTYASSSQAAFNLNPYGAVAGNTGEIRFLELAAGGTNYVGFKAPDSLAADNIYTLPTVYPDISGKVLTSTTGGVLSWSTAGAGGAPTDAQYVTLSLNDTLTAERVLTGTTNQITVTDGGANGNVTLSLPQNIHTGATPQFARLGLGVAADATNILTATSTSATDLSKALNISHTGAITGTGYAGYFSKTGTSTTNVGLYATASGSTNNYAAIFESGSVGIGTTTPTEKLTVRQDSVVNLLGLYDGANNTVLAINDGGVTSFKPSALDLVYYYDAAPTPTYNDQTAEAKTSGGTAFTLIGLDTADYLYLGLDHPFATVYFDIATARAGGSGFTAQYYSTTWSALAITDNTTALSTDGTITWTTPSDWATTAVNGQTKYWVRFNFVTTAPTTAPTAYSVSPTTGNRFYVYSQAGDTNPAIYINDKGNVGIGTTTPSYKLDVSGTGRFTSNLMLNTFTFEPISATELGLYDSGDNPLIIFDELSSPIIWGQNLSSEFSQGSFDQTITSNDRVILAKDQNGAYFASGTFISSTYDYKGKAEFLIFRTTIHKTSLTRLIAQVQSSDDNFSTIKGSINFELANDTQTYDLSSLASARYVRAKFDFQTEDPFLSPELIHFEVWTNLIEEPSKVGEPSEDNNTSSISSQISEDESQILEKIIPRVKNILENLGLVIQDGLTKVRELVAEKVTTTVAEVGELIAEKIVTKELTTPKLCLEKNGEKICIAEFQLKELLEKSGAQAINNGSSDNSGATEPPAVCDNKHLDLCTTQELCEGANLWYKETCNAGLEEEPKEPVCDNEHLDLCITQELCEGASLYWYNETCNTEPEAPACTPNWSCAEWEPTLSSIACGQTFTQTRTCTDSNSCDINDGKPAESQDVQGTLCSADNTTGTCQTDGICSFTCQGGFSNCDNDWSNGCETQGECQPPPQTDTTGGNSSERSEEEK